MSTENNLVVQPQLTPFEVTKEEKESQKGFDMAEPAIKQGKETEDNYKFDKAGHALTGGVILPKEDNGFSNRPAFGEVPKINPSKPVILGSNVETKSDKELLEEFANKLVLLPNPHVVSEKAQKHLDFVQGMLAKLADQTIKVAGGF